MDRLNKIERLKDRLYATDYIVLKEYEGIDVSEHGNFHAERQAIRDEINRLQGMTEEEYYEAYPDEREASPTYEDEPLLSDEPTGASLLSEQVPTDAALL